MKYKFLLALLLGLKAIVCFWFVQQPEVGLGPDEAQYWTWSQSLDWGYYSKPPGIAWQIAAGTEVFGDTQLGVRVISILMATVLSILIYYLASVCRCLPRTCFWAAATMALSPIGLLNSYLAITDAGLVLFWTLACVMVTYSLAHNQVPNYYLLGFVISLGALFKWPIYFFWVFVMGMLYWHRAWLNRSLIGGMALSLLGLLPSIAWNAQHRWVTFLHVGHTLLGGSENIAKTTVHGNFFEFLGSQILLVSPILFGLLVLAWVKVLKNKIRPFVFIAYTSLIPLAAYSVYSIFKKTQGNWCDYAYPVGFVLIAWYACEQMKAGVKWLFGGISLSLLLTVLGFSIPYVQSNSFLASHPIPYKINPFKHNLGWLELQKSLDKAGYDPNRHFLFSDRYQTTSILSFYSTGQKRAYFFNLGGIRFNQFSFWPSMADEQRGHDGYFVLVENEAIHETKAERLADYQKKLGNYFQEVTLLEPQPLFLAYGKPMKFAYLFLCKKYNGTLPLDSNLY